MMGVPGALGSLPADLSPIPRAATRGTHGGWLDPEDRLTRGLLLFQWDLVCSAQGLKPMGQSIYMAGILVGFFIWGLLSHR